MRPSDKSGAGRGVWEASCSQEAPEEAPEKATIDWSYMRVFVLHKVIAPSSGRARQYRSETVLWQSKNKSEKSLQSGSIVSVWNDEESTRIADATPTRL